MHSCILSQSLPGGLIVTDQNTIMFNSEIYKNAAMTATEAREWLNATPVGDPIVVDVLTRIAAGEYPRILDELDRFIRIFTRSKHNEDRAALRQFVASMVPPTLCKIHLKRHAQFTVSVLLENPRWKSEDVLIQRTQDYEAWRSSRRAAKL